MISLDKNKIIERLTTIFNYKFNFDIGKLGDDFLDKELLGYEIRLAPRDLVYLVFEIEKEFGIIILQDDITAGNFKTLNGIVDVIESHMNKSERAAI